MVSLKVSPSITSAPELEPVGDSLLVMAWIPCRVPARTRYSFEVNWASPSECGVRRELIQNTLRETCEIALIYETTSFVDYLEKNEYNGGYRAVAPTQSP